MPCPLPSPQAGTLTCELSSCPYCTSALEDPELEFSDSGSGDSDSNGVYEFTQDVRHGDHRDPMQSPPEAEAPGAGGTRRRGPRRAAAGEQGGLGRIWASFSGKLRRIVDSKYFNRGIMVAILTNTLSMGVEYHEQVGAHTDSPQRGPGAPPAYLCLLQALVSHGLHRGLSGVGEQAWLWGWRSAVLSSYHSGDAPAACWWASAEWRTETVAPVRRSSVWGGAPRGSREPRALARPSGAFQGGTPRAQLSWTGPSGWDALGGPRGGMWRWHMVLARGPCPVLGLPRGAVAGPAGRGHPLWGLRPVHS